MKKLKLTLNQQRYIETIHVLCGKHGHAHTKAIAEKLGVKMPSVTEAIASLAKKGLVNYKVRCNITLTSLGKKYARELEEKHQILADFFHGVLGTTRERADEIACQVEHVIDLKLSERMTEFVKFLKKRHEKEGVDIISEFKKFYNRTKSS